VTVMRNQNGVVVEMKSTTQGASLKLGAEGIRLSLATVAPAGASTAIVAALRVAVEATRRRQTGAQHACRPGGWWRFAAVSASSWGSPFCCGRA